MILTPRLINNFRTISLPNTLFSDLQLDKILSAQAIAVLQHPCEPDEIVKRNELFLLLDKSENVTILEDTLSVLFATERALFLLKETKITLDTYYRQAELFESYLASCRALASMQDLGTLFADVADYYSSEKVQMLLSEMKESAHKIRSLLFEMSTGLLSFADKNWLTPDYDAVSEIDNMSDCAEHLGFSVPKRNRRIPKSTFLCRMLSVVFIRTMLHRLKMKLPNMPTLIFTNLLRIFPRSNSFWRYTA